MRMVADAAASAAQRLRSNLCPAADSQLTTIADALIERGWPRNLHLPQFRSDHRLRVTANDNRLRVSNAFVTDA